MENSGVRDRSAHDQSGDPLLKAFIIQQGEFMKDLTESQRVMRQELADTRTAQLAAEMRIAARGEPDSGPLCNVQRRKEERKIYTLRY